LFIPDFLIIGLLDAMSPQRLSVFRIVFKAIRSGLLITCLTAAVGAINFGLVRLVQFIPNPASTNEFYVAFYGGGIMGQATIPAIWCVFSRGSLFWRFCVYFFAVQLLSLPGYVSIDADELLPTMQLTLPVELSSLIPLVWAVENVILTRVLAVKF
jgi:hypothetical protein